MSGHLHSKGSQLLKAALATRGMRLFRLEQEMQIARGLVTRWINGERRPRLEQALILEQRFQIPPSSWLEATQPDAPSPEG